MKGRPRPQRGWSLFCFPPEGEIVVWGNYSMGGEKGQGGREWRMERGEGRIENGEWRMVVRKASWGSRHHPCEGLSGLNLVT